MLEPTHVQVTVRQGRGLRSKGKNGTNDAYVVIGLGKEKFQTSVQEKVIDPIWNEEAELSIPKHGNKAEIHLTVYHRHNGVALDEFLGTIYIPLQDLDIHEPPRNRWYGLLGKGFKDDGKDRGELEVRIGFVSQPLNSSVQDVTGHLSVTTSPKKSGSVLSMGKSFGGSLLSLGKTETKNLKKLAGKMTKNRDGQSTPRSSKSARSSQRSEHGISGFDKGAGLYPLGISTPLSGSKEGLDQAPEKAPPAADWPSAPQVQQRKAHEKAVSPVPEADDWTEDVRKASPSSTLERNSNNSSSLDKSHIHRFEKRLGAFARSSPSTPVMSARKRSQGGADGALSHVPTPAIPLNEADTLVLSSTNSLDRDQQVGAPGASLPVPPPRRRSETEPGDVLLVKENEEPKYTQLLPPRRFVRSNTESCLWDMQDTSDNSGRRKERKKLLRDAKEALKEGFREVLPLSTSRYIGARGERTKPILDPTHGSSAEPSPIVSVRPMQIRGPYEGGIAGGNWYGQQRSRHPLEVQQRFGSMSRDDLIERILRLEGEVTEAREKTADLGTYLDSLLLRIMETKPEILQVDWSKRKVQKA
ncbi:unnamed protein product [Cyprideis torosa]|uniref:Uncharacterized protein n=2 Tax=Cyprideis torosa TaxID=163714 RepID=A0A7R8ZTQ6_9CRUS|nr:unnamed protein product [Cyprideis torosa]CAG0898525.1 unnamed protein product [Cyprideis torosa]